MSVAGPTVEKPDARPGPKRPVPWGWSVADARGVAGLARWHVPLPIAEADRSPRPRRLVVVRLWCLNTGVTR